MDLDALPDYVSAFGFITVTIIGLYFGRAAARSSEKRSVDEERARLLLDLALAREPVQSPTDRDGKGPDKIDPSKIHLEESSTVSDRFARLLVEYYAHGLAQAKRSGIASLLSSYLGGVVLVAGVVIAAISARSNESQLAAAVVSLSGILTSGLGLLFHRQANRALSHLEDQTRNLRQDMARERETTTAIELVDEIAEDELRDRVRATLVVRMVGASPCDLSTSSWASSPGPPEVRDVLAGARPASD